MKIIDNYQNMAVRCSCFFDSMSIETCLSETCEIEATFM